MKRLSVWVLGFSLVAGSFAVRAAAKGDAAKGKEVFQQCATCHDPDSTDKKVGPGLKGLYKRDKMANGKKPTDATVRARIDEGGAGMPAYKDLLSDQEKDDLLAYLKTL